MHESFRLLSHLMVLLDVVSGSEAFLVICNDVYICIDRWVIVDDLLMFHVVQVIDKTFCNEK